MLAPFRFLWRLLAGFADFVRKLLSIVLLFVLIAVLIVAMQGAPAPEVEEGVALVIAPSGLIVEYDDTDPRERVLDEILGEPPAVMPMADLTTAIEAATDRLAAPPYAVLGEDDARRLFDLIRPVAAALNDGGAYPRPWTLPERF